MECFSKSDGAYGGTLVMQRLVDNLREELLIMAKSVDSLQYCFEQKFDKNEEERISCQLL